MTRSTGVQEYRSSPAIRLSSGMLVTNRDSWVGTDWYDCCILTRTILAIQGLSSQLDLLKDASVCPHTASHWLLQGYNKLKIVFGCFDTTCDMWHVTVDIGNTNNTLHTAQFDGKPPCELSPIIWILPQASPWEPVLSALGVTGDCTDVYGQVKWRFMGPRKFSANICCCRTLKTARMAVAAASTLVAGGQEVIYLLQLAWGQQLFFTNPIVSILPWPEFSSPCPCVQVQHGGCGGGDVPGPWWQSWILL